MPERKSKNQSWHVYIVRCTDGSLYTGIAKKLHERIEEHNIGNNGAKYTRSRRPVKLVYYEYQASRSAASKREAVIKRMTKQAKEALIAPNMRNA